MILKAEHVFDAQKAAEQLNGILIDMDKMKGDDFLYVVMVRRMGALGMEYVVWTYNANDKGFSSGNYYQWENLDIAYEKFHEKLA